MIDEIPERDHNPNHSTTNSMSLRRIAILLTLVFIVLVAMLLGSRALDTLALKLWPAPMPTKSTAFSSVSGAPSNSNPIAKPNVTVVQVTSPTPGSGSGSDAASSVASSVTSGDLTAASVATSASIPAPTSASGPATHPLDPTGTFETTATIPPSSPNQELAAAGTLLNPLSPTKTDNNTINTMQSEVKTALGNQTVLQENNNINLALPETKESTESKVQPTAETSKEPKNKKDVKQYTAAEKEILKHDPRHYTVQILGMHSKAKLQSFVNETKLKGKVRYCRGSHQGKPWYVLVYGNYGTKEEAQKGLAELPEEIKKQKPWVRSFASLQGTIHARE